MAVGGSRIKKGIDKPLRGKRNPRGKRNLSTESRIFLDQFMRAPKIRGDLNSVSFFDLSAALERLRGDPKLQKTVRTRFEKQLAPAVAKRIVSIEIERLTEEHEERVHRDIKPWKDKKAKQKMKKTVKRKTRGTGERRDTIRLSLLNPSFLAMFSSIPHTWHRFLYTETVAAGFTGEEDVIGFLGKRRKLTMTEYSRFIRQFPRVYQDGITALMDDQIQKQKVKIAF